MFCEPDMVIDVMPITSPYALNSGPSLLPGEM